MDAELPRVFDAHLSRVATQLPPGVTISASGTLPVPLNVRVTLDRSIYPSRLSMFGIIPRGNLLQDALGLHIEFLTLAFKTRGATEMYDQTYPHTRWWIHRWLVYLFVRNAKMTNVRRVIVEVDMFDIGVSEERQYMNNIIPPMEFMEFLLGWTQRCSGKIGHGDGCFKQLIWEKDENAWGPFKLS
jgi:hypothetical protein